MGLFRFFKKNSKINNTKIENFLFEEKYITESKEKYIVKFDPSMEEIIIEKEHYSSTESIKINQIVFMQLWNAYLKNILYKEASIHTQTGTESWGEDYTLFIGKTNEGNIKIQYTLHFGAGDETEAVTIKHTATTTVIGILGRVYEILAAHEK